MSKKEKFIEKAQKVHGSKYTYDKVVYIGSRDKVAITCQTHGDFFQEPASHIRGTGCSKCSGMHQYTTLEFIALAKEIHGDNYVYDNTEYINIKTRITVECKNHGVFYQKASDHIQGSGCRKCFDENRTLTTEQFIKKAKLVHGDKYDYSKICYVGTNDKVIITCKKHGDFKQSPNTHTKGSGCSKCSNINKIKKSPFTSEEFIEKATVKHNDLYSYGKVDYINSQTRVTITCSIHGDFKQKPNAHLTGEGCPKCGKESHWRRSDYVKKANGRICTFYTIRCFNEEESFYKIGITMRSIKKRYYNIKTMPYAYEIISEIFGEAEFIWNLEKEEKRKLKGFSYQPNIPFAGSKTECFTHYKL